jgi:hypothetical protein
MNTLANTLVVGSRCIPELKRRPKDLDVITTQAGFDEMVVKSKDIQKIYRVKAHLIVD